MKEITLFTFLAKQVGNPIAAALNCATTGWVDDLTLTEKIFTLATN